MAEEIEKQAIRSILHEINSPTIVELGAHTGDDSEWLIDACRGVSGPEAAHHVMVEPDPRNCQAILDRAPTSRTRRLIIGAISDKAGMQPFHFAHNTQDGSHASGSLRMPTGHIGLIPEVAFEFTGMVPCLTLDQLFEREWLTRINLLWVDIQGAEDMMIRGGRNALRHTEYLFIEKEHVELYAGEALRDDLLGMLHGWILVAEFPYNMLLRNPAFVEREPR